MSPERRWTIVGMLCIAMMVAFVDRATLSVAIASASFKSHFGLSDAGRGALNSAFFWTYALLQIPAGFLVDRYGSRRPYAFFYFFWCCVAAATSLATTFAQLLALRMLLGIGESVATPASLRWIGLHLPEHRRGLAVGLLFAFAKLGPAFGTWLSAHLLQQYGWQWMFALIGLGGLIWLIPWLAFSREEAQPAPKVDFRGNKPSVLPLFRTPLIWGVLLGTFCYNYFQYFCLTWLPAYFVEQRGLTLSNSSLYSAFSFGGMAIVATLGGFFADKLIARGQDAVRVRRAFTVAGFMIAATEVLGARTESLNVALLVAVVSLSGLGLATANYWTLTQTLLPGPLVGRIAGIQNTASNLAGIAAPLLTGWLKQTTGSYAAPLQAVWVFLILGLGAYLFLVRRRFVPVEFRT